MYDLVKYNRLFQKYKGRVPYEDLSQTVKVQNDFVHMTDPLEIFIIMLEDIIKVNKPSAVNFC